MTEKVALMISDVPSVPNSLFVARSAADLLGIFTAHWRSAILASAVDLEIFSHLERRSSNLTELSQALNVSARALQALLDGLATFGLVERDDSGAYTNSVVATAHLIKGKPGYLGGFARIVTGPGDGGMRQWSRLPEALRLGRPVQPETILEPDSPFWPELVMALLPLSREVANIAADLVGVRTREPMSVLDVGGGAGAYALSWLPMNTKARFTQIDWTPVNALARENVEAGGWGERFTTLDGDFRAVPFGTAEHDVVVLSNICHHETPDQIVALLKRIATSLAPGGKLVLSEFVLNDNRVGPAFAACFGVGMALQTTTGASYRESDYQQWLATAGFDQVRVDRSHPLSTLLVAQRDSEPHRP